MNDDDGADRANDDVIGWCWWFANMMKNVVQSLTKFSQTIKSNNNNTIRVYPFNELNI